MDPINVLMLRLIGKAVTGRSPSLPVLRKQVSPGCSGHCVGTAARTGLRGICPYQLEINDKESWCDCCDECRNQCVDDI